MDINDLKPHKDILDSVYKYMPQAHSFSTIVKTVNVKEGDKVKISAPNTGADTYEWYYEGNLIATTSGNS